MVFLFQNQTGHMAFFFVMYAFYRKEVLKWKNHMIL